MSQEIDENLADYKDNRAITNYHVSGSSTLTKAIDWSDKLFLEQYVVKVPGLDDMAQQGNNVYQAFVNFIFTGNSKSEFPELASLVIQLHPFITKDKIYQLGESYKHTSDNKANMDQTHMLTREQFNNYKPFTEDSTTIDDTGELNLASTTSGNAQLTATDTVLVMRNGIYQPIPTEEAYEIYKKIFNAYAVLLANVPSEKDESEEEDKNFQVKMANINYVKSVSLLAMVLARMNKVEPETVKSYLQRRFHSAAYSVTANRYRSPIIPFLPSRAAIEAASYSSQNKVTGMMPLAISVFYYLKITKGIFQLTKEPPKRGINSEGEQSVLTELQAGILVHMSFNGMAVIRCLESLQLRTGAAFTDVLNNTTSREMESFTRQIIRFYNRYVMEGYMDIIRDGTKQKYWKTAHGSWRWARAIDDAALPFLSPAACSLHLQKYIYLLGYLQMGEEVFNDATGERATIAIQGLPKGEALQAWVRGSASKFGITTRPEFINVILPPASDEPM